MRRLGGTALATALILSCDYDGGGLAGDAGEGATADAGNSTSDGGATAADAGFGVGLDGGVTDPSPAVTGLFGAKPGCEASDGGSYALVDLGYGTAFAVSNGGYVTGTSDAPDYDGFVYDVAANSWAPVKDALPKAVNNQGDIAAEYLLYDWLSDAAVYDRRGTRQFDFSSAWFPTRRGSARATGINDWGHAVFTYELADGGQAGAMSFADRSIQAIPSSGGADYPMAINNAGQIAGFSYHSNAFSSFIVDADGVRTDFSRGAGTEIFGLNELGHAVGLASDLGNFDQTYAVKYANGQVTALPPAAGFTTSAAFGINNHDDVVGYLGWYQSAFLYSRGSMVDLNLLLQPTAAWMTVAYGINDSGWIVGEGTCSDGFGHAFLLIPK